MNSLRHDKFSKYDLEDINLVSKAQNIFSSSKWI